MLGQQEFNTSNKKKSVESCDFQIEAALLNNQQEQNQVNHLTYHQQATQTNNGFTVVAKGY